MFCPNCATDNSVGLNYCRSCGLKLDAIVDAVADQLPSNPDVELHRRRKKFERIGRTSLATYGVISLALLVFFVSQYKNFGDFFGPVLLIAIVAMAWLFLVAAGFLYYSKVFLKHKHPPHPEVPVFMPDTGKLIEDRPFEPAPASVTEDTTELLDVPRTQGR